MANPASVSIGATHYRAEIRTGEHTIIADEPLSNGGGDAGPSPSELLLSSLGACTAITLRMYSENKGWDTGEIKVHLELIKHEDSYTIQRTLSFEKELTDEQKERLVNISGKCPVAKILKGNLELSAKIN